MNNQSVIACQNLTKTYNDGASRIEVLKQVDFNVQHGEMIAIVGNSGSGKSTLLQLLGGLDKPTSGTVLINNEDVNQLSETKKCYLRNRYLGFVYQFHHLLPEFTALENVGMPLLIRDEKPDVIKDKAASLLTKVGLEKRLTHRLGQLSGGERQRVAIARALVTDPLCILADEPTGNLDPSNAERVLDLFIQLQNTFKTSVVMVTHDVTIANRAHRILRIDEGQLKTA